MLLSQAKTVVDQVLSKINADSVLQIGEPAALCAQLFERFPYKACIDRLPSTGLLGTMVPKFGELVPLLPESLDVVVLAHQLRSIEESEQILTIVHQLLKVNGRIILVEFNRHALMRQWWVNAQKVQFPDVGACPSVQVKAWLSRLDFQLLFEQTVGFRPPLNTELQADRFLFLELLGQLLCPSFGMVSIMTAQKVAVGMTPEVEASWLRRFQLLPNQTVGTSV